MMAREENVQKRGVAVTDAMNGAMNGAARGLGAVFEAPFEAAFALSRTHLGPAMPQLPLGDDKVGQSEHADHLCLGPGQALVGNLLSFEQVLDHMERVLDLRADAGLERSARSRS